MSWIFSSASEREREGERAADSASINYAGRFPSRFLFIHRDSGEEKRRRTPVRLALRAASVNVRASQKPAAGRGPARGVQVGITRRGKLFSVRSDKDASDFDAVGEEKYGMNLHTEREVPRVCAHCFGSAMLPGRPETFTTSGLSQQLE